MRRAPLRARQIGLDRRRALGQGWVLIGIGGLLIAWAAAANPEGLAIGAIVGCLYALGAVGLTLIHGIARVPHFAHGDAMMLGAYIAFGGLFGAVAGADGDAVSPLRLERLPGAMEPIWRFSFGYGLVGAIVAAAALTAPLLLALDRLVYRRLLRRGAGTAVLAIASLGVAIAMRGALLIVWGPTPRKYTTGIRERVELPGLPPLLADQLFILGAALVVGIATALLLYRTAIGTAMRATADNADLALASGIAVAAVRRWTWGIGGALVAVAGCLLALQSQLKPELGFTLILPIFAAAIVGGIGSPHGAIVGGLLVGIVGELTVGLGVVDPAYKTAVALAVLIAAILVRPRGLFGGQT
jgi:branched-subunit amino acid ABC-type transport system permease component